MKTLLRFDLTKTALLGVTFFVLISTSPLLAQNNRIDSLKQKLESTPELESFEINFQLAREFIIADKRIAVQYAWKARSLAYLKQDSLNMARSLRLSGQIHRRLDNLDSSVYYLLKGLPIATRKKIDEERNAIFNSLGVTYINLSQYDQALYYLLQSAVLYEKSEDQSMFSVVENNLGVVYYKLNDFRLALEHYKKSLKIKMAINDSFAMDILQINMSLCDAHLDNLAEARKRLKPVTEKCNIKCDDNTFINAMYASGVIWHKLDSVDKAEKDFFRSYAAAKKTNNQRFIFDNIIYLSQIYLRQSNLSACERLLVEGEKMTNESHFDLEEMKLYEQFCTLYKAKGNYKKLSFYQKKYIQAKDSIYTQGQANNLMRLHSEATEKENKIQLASQEQTLQLKNQIINKQTGIIILIAITILLLIILIYVLTKIFLQRKEANYLLNKKVLQRSDELLQNQQSLKLAIEQRDVALAKLSRNLSNSIVSMQGLCSAGSERQADSNALRYFNEIYATTSNLSTSLQSILPESKMIRLTGS